MTSRRLLSLLLPIAALACASAPPLVREFDGQRAFGYARAQLAFGPRTPGTPAHERMGDWLDSTLRRRAA